MTLNENIAPIDVEQQLLRILASAEFQASAAISQFLHYAVTESLAGRAERLKAYTIAVNAYGRQPDFDPQTDTLVRVHARRLRRALERYYLTDGANDPLVIVLTPGSYVPQFRRRAAPSGGLATGSGVHAGAAHKNPAILVLPLEPLGMPEHEFYVADGFTEQLGAVLTTYQGIRVFGPLRRTRLAADSHSAAELAIQHGADFLLRGTLRKHDAMIKVSVQLVEQATGETVWSGQYDNRLEPTEWFDFEAHVAACVANTVAGSFGVVMRRLTRRLLEQKTPSHVSFDAMLRWHHYFTVLTGEAWQEARTALERAIDVDPDYAPTHAMLADMYGAEYHVMGADRAMLARAEALVNRALSLDPDNLFAHFMRASLYMLQGQRDLFFHKAAYVLGAAPRRADLLGGLGVFLGFWGDWDRGLDLVREAMALNPHYPGWYHYLPFLAAYRAGDHERALAETTRFNSPGFYWDVLLRTAVLGRLGRRAAAAAHLAQLVDLLPQTELDLTALMRRTVLTDDNVAAILDGLHCAGLPIVEKPRMV